LMIEKWPQTVKDNGKGVIRMQYGLVARKTRYEDLKLRTPFIWLPRVQFYGGFDNDERIDEIFMIIRPYKKGHYFNRLTFLFDDGVLRSIVFRDEEKNTIRSSWVRSFSPDVKKLLKSELQKLGEVLTSDEFDLGGKIWHRGHQLSRGQQMMQRVRQVLKTRESREKEKEAAMAYRLCGKLRNVHVL